MTVQSADESQKPARMEKGTPADVAHHNHGQTKWQFAQNLIASYGFYFSGYLLALLVVPYLARVLGPSHWGVLALTQTFAMYIILIVDSGFAFSATKLVARNREHPEVLSDILAGVWSAKAVLALFCIFLAFAATRVAPVFRDNPLLFWSGVAWGILQGANMNWYYQGLERMRTAATVDIAIKAVAILLTILLVRTPDQAWRACAFNAAACLISLTVLSTIAYRDVPWRLPSWHNTVSNLKTGVHALLPRNSFVISSLSGVFILGIYAPPEALGHYAGADRISRAVMGLLVPLTDALYARINRIMVSSPDSFFPVARRVMVVMGGCGLAMGAAIYIYAPLLVHIVLGSDFGAAVATLRIFALLGPFIAVGNTLGAHWMLSLGLDRTFSQISLGSALFSIVLCLFLAPHFGAFGVAWVIVTSQLLLTSAAYLALRRHRRHRNRQSAPLAAIEEGVSSAQDTGSPEWAMLFAIARCRLDACNRERVQQLSRLPLDWNRLFELASEHGVLPLLHRHLMAASPQSIPPDVMKTMSTKAFAISSRNLFLTAELVRIVSLLEESGVAAIPFKGPVLANAVYGDLSLRTFGDLDILVRPTDLKRARHALTAGGYHAEFGEDAEVNKYIYSAEKVLRFIKREGFVVIEMHWEFAPRNMGFPDCANPALWARCQTSSFGGKTMTLLRPEDVVLQLCFHGAKHCWDKLEWICSLAELLASQKNLNWPWIHEYARECSSERVLHLGLALSRRLLGRLPDEVGLQELNPESERLAELVLQNMVSLTREDTRKAPYRYRFYLRAKDRVQDRIRMLFLASGQTLRPRELRRSYRTLRVLQETGE